MTSKLVKKENRYYLALFLSIDIEQAQPIYLAEIYFPNMASLEVVERFLIKNEK